MINMDPLRMNMAYFRNKHDLLLIEPQNEQNYRYTYILQFLFTQCHHIFIAGMLSQQFSQMFYQKMALTRFILIIQACKYFIQRNTVHNLVN